MDYDILELAPIVAQLVEKYNASGKGSAGKGETEQFMGAIAFCIDEVMKNGAAVEIAAENMSAAQSYVDGLKLVVSKLKETAAAYNAEMANFNHYGNKNLCNTFTKELRPFFEKYDPVFNPQCNVVNLGYPLLVDLSDYKGVDRIAEYLRLLSMEQTFLRSMPATYVETAAAAYSDKPEDIKENLLGVVIRDISIHALCAKPINKPELTDADLRKSKLLAKQDGPKKCTDSILMVLNLLIKRCFGDETDFVAYVTPAIESTLKELMA